MSHLRRIAALIVLALVGWLLAFVAVGAVSASASAAPMHRMATPGITCC